MPRQIQGSQWDFSYGEVDPDLKRCDSHPARKGGLRQMSNARIKNSGTLQNRSGRSALFPIPTAARIEEITMSSGNDFKLAFGAGELRIFNSAGTQVKLFTLQGNGAVLPWTAANASSIIFAALGLNIYLTFGFSMRPQVITWDGLATWSIADYTEYVTGNQKRTWFYRISPQNITILPGAQSGSTSLVASAALFTAGHVGTRMRFVNRQMLITAVADPLNATVTIEETLPGHQSISFSINCTTTYSLGDVVTGSTSGSKGIVTAISATAIDVQLISTNSRLVYDIYYNPSLVAFINTETVVGPGGGISATSVGGITAPTIGITFWDEEVMNSLRGFPAACFVDQFRLGFNDFPSVPGGIGWSAINSPTDLYVGGPTVPNGAIFEIAPNKTRVYYVVPGPEGSEFVFGDNRVYYIPINETNPLKPGSVAFKTLTGDGAGHVIPHIAQEAILYCNAGLSTIMAVIATGAYQRPFATKSLTDFHAHLFENVVAIACPNADGQFNERYAYVLNGDGSISVGKYSAESLPGNAPVIGWGPWSGAGTVKWISAWKQDVLFTTSYFGSTICEILDDSVYMDASLFVNALPAPFTPPGGQGPLWWIPNRSVSLMDQVTRNMGIYQIDANGFIVPQFNGGEDLTRASLVAGQTWAMVAEPFAPDAQPGADVGQRMKKRSFSYFAAYVINSTGFAFETLFSSQQLPTSPALGTPMNRRDVPAYNAGEDATKPPTQRETVEFYAPQGTVFDPRAAIIKDTPGPLLIAEIAMEITI